MHPPDWTYTLISSLFFTADLLVRLGFSLRVIMRKRNYAVSYAWLIIILLIPIFGSLIYLLFGENRLSERRLKRSASARSYYHSWLQQLTARPKVAWDKLNPELSPIHLHTLNLVGIPAMAGNKITFYKDTTSLLFTIIRDIQSATSTCHLEFYIWEEGGLVDDVTKALINAAKRGVTCRLLLDSIGSRAFFSTKSALRLKEAGVKIQEALPAGILKALFSRIDIRNHRKIIIIDGEIGYTGSQNMVDPQYFKQDAGVGKWIDLMARVQGPVVETLAGTFASDWYLDADSDSFKFNEHATERQLRELGDIHSNPICGEAAIQMVPSGPGFTQEAVHSLLLTVIYSARRELILTTPYFIPDESLLIALKAASLRGVHVRLIIPKQNDSRLVQYASRAKFEDLAHTGVEILLFTGGLLHAKTVTVDGDLALFGSVNLDMRSFWINFEATLVLYCSKSTQAIRDNQFEYIEASEPLDLLNFYKRNYWEKFKENISLLVSPIL